MLAKKVFNKINFSDALICCALLIIVAFFSGSYALFFATTFVLASALFALGIYKHKNGMPDSKGVNFSVIFFVLIATGSLAVVARNLGNINAVVGIALIFLNLVLIAACITLVLLLKTASKITLDFVFKCLPFAAVAVLLFLLSFDLFKTIPIFDDWFYYDNLWSALNINTLNDISALKMCAHMTHFWSLAVYVIYCVIGDLFKALVLFNVLLLIISFFVAYKMVRLVCPACKHWFAYLCAAVFAFSPFALGFAGYACPQTILAYTTLFFVCAFITKDRFLIFITSAMLMFTFETGIFLTAAMLFFYIAFGLVRAARSKTFVAELKKRGLNVLNICLFLLHVVWLIIFLRGNWGGIGQGGQAGGGLEYEFNKALFQNLTLLTNFHWIIYAGIAAALVKAAVKIAQKKLKLRDIFASPALLIIITAYFISLASFIFITTFTYVRYMLSIYVCSYFLFFASVHYLLRDIKLSKLRAGLSYGVMAGMLLILTLQSFVTIDPVMLAIKEKTYMGSGKNYVVNAAYNDYDNQPFGNFIWDFFDGYVYNKQASNFTIAFNKAMGSIDYDTTKCVIVGNDLANQYILENKYFCLGYRHAESRGFRSWDSEKKRQVISLDKDDAIRYTIRSDADKVLSLLTEGEFAEYWFLDYNSGLAPSIQSLAAVNGNIIINQSHSVSYMGWKFTLTKISLG